MTGLTSLWRRRSQALRRLLAAASPQRRRVEKAIAAPVGCTPLPETGERIRRYFTGPPALPPPPRPGPQTPTVTVVIPVYNTEAWLDDCLSSVLAQRGVDIEVVCVNDGSTDRSRSVLERYARQDSRIRILDQPNSGQSVGRNVGIDAARGRYLIYLDSDDFWPADGLADLVRRAERDRLDVLMFDGTAFRDGDVPEDIWRRYATYYLRARSYRRVRTGAQMIADMRRARDYRPHLGMYLTRTQAVRQSGVRFIPGIVHQDNPYTFALLVSADRVAHTRRCFYARRLRPGSTITALRAQASAKGYFLSYLAMSRELATRRYDSRTTHSMDEVVLGVFDSARQQLSLLPAAAREEIRSLDLQPDAQEAFQRLSERSA